MNNDIMQRAMFAMPLSPEAQNSGIMSGFMDEEPMSPEDEALEEMPVMARTPQNPEILMNNLRGDMRSLDARYVELAQMVGEQAAMDTPPEVLAMLMGQMGAQQPAAGIGALPQGQEMMPPGMEGMGAPGMEQGMPPGMEQGMPPMDPAMMQQGMPDQGMQGAPMMPQGMEGMGPFPLGGAEQAPPQQFARGGEARPRRFEGNAMFTPDGRMRPITDEEIQNMPFQPTIGGMIAPVRSIAGGLLRGQEAAGRGAQALNQALGNRFITPQFTTQAMRGADGGRLVGQARESLRQLPGGQIVPGQGTQFAPLTTLGQMQSPTLTQGLQQALSTPAGRAAGAVGAGGATAAGMYNMFLDDPAVTEEDMEALQGSGLADRIPPATMDDLLALTQEKPPTVSPVEEVVTPTVADAIAGREAPADDTKGFIDRVDAQEKQRTKGDRIRERFDDLSPLYRELLGEDADSRKQQALLLLAEAGFKFAGTAKPTMGMALADAMSGIPAGMSALAAQKAEREAKVKASALSQAVEDIGAEDTAARQMQLEMLKGDYRLLQAQAKQSGGKVTDAGFGLRAAEDGSGNFIGYSINENDPSVVRASTSRFTLNEDNPFVVNAGPVPQSFETNKEERIKLGVALRNLDNALVAIEQGKSELAGTQGPGAYISNFSNAVFSPVLPVTPNIEAQKKFSTVNPILNRVAAGIANAQQTGRVAVQELEWIREDMPARSARFWKDPELAATEWNALHAQVLNARQNVVSQLLDVPSELIMKVPATGTKNDPFVLPADEQGRVNMVRFLSNEFSKVTDPKARVYLRTPDGRVAPYNVSTLRREIGAQ
jgi:hypothetical protein